MPFGWQTAEASHTRSCLHITTCTYCTGPAASTPAAALASPAPPLPEAAAPSDIPEQAPIGHSSLFTADVGPAKLKPGVYARGRHTADTAQAQLNKVTGGARYADHFARSAVQQVTARRFPVAYCMPTTEDISSVYATRSICGVYVCHTLLLLLHDSPKLTVSHTLSCHAVM